MSKSSKTPTIFVSANYLSSFPFAVLGRRRGLARYLLKFLGGWIDLRANLKAGGVFARSRLVQAAIQADSPLPA